MVGNSLNFREAVEFNLQTNYVLWLKNNVKLNRYKGQNLDTWSQPEPNLIADFKESLFQQKRIHGLDQKSGETSKVKLFLAELSRLT